MKYSRLEPMVKPLRGQLALLSGAFVAALSCASCVGLESGIEYPDTSEVDLDEYLVTPEGDQNPSLTLSEFKISERTCRGIDTHMVTGPLDQEDLSRFFASRGISLKPKKARNDLYWYEFPASDDPADGSVRLRVAILKDRNAAAKDLHDSLLQHGPGWWGLRRGNLAVLVPRASLDEAMAFAIKYRLVCWGMFTYTGVDDTYVVAGGYSEF